MASLGRLSDSDTPVTSDPKPRARYRATPAEWARMRVAFYLAPCWVCGEYATELHHILPKDGHGTWPPGDDLLVNLAPVCSGCHVKIEARDVGARAAIRGALMPSTINYLVFRLGGKVQAETFLDRHYPR